MSPRKSADDDFDELHFSSDERDYGNERKRRKTSKAQKNKKSTRPSRSEYEFDSDESDYSDHDDYIPDYDADDWKTSFNPPYTR